MRSRDLMAVVVVLVPAAFAVGVLAADDAVTYARWSDDASVSISAGAGTWGPPPPVVPAACGPAEGYSGVLVGTEGDDVLEGGNRGQVVLGLGGDDVLVGGNARDCLVGGDGDDVLVGGNGPDVLLGGAGDDALDGGNGPDLLDGGDGDDTCAPGRGPGTETSCERAADTSPRRVVHHAAEEPSTPGSPVPGPAPAEDGVTPSPADPALD